MIGQFELLLPGRQIRELVLMMEIERDPAISQSRLARKAGLAPSMVNNYIRRMSESGLLDKQGTNCRDTTYHLTVTGLARSAELMRRYSIETVRLYKYAKEEFRRRIREALGGRKGLRVALYGAAETGELVYQVCRELGHEVVGVVDSDPSRQGKRINDCQVSDPDCLPRLGAQVVLISSLGHAEEIAGLLEPLRRRGMEIRSLG